MRTFYRKNYKEPKIEKPYAPLNMNYGVDAREIALCISAQIENLI